MAALSSSSPGLMPDLVVAPRGCKCGNACARNGRQARLALSGGSFSFVLRAGLVFGGFLERELQKICGLRNRAVICMKVKKCFLRLPCERGSR